jgi:GNAT superfamily N-acetyltransferase
MTPAFSARRAVLDDAAHIARLSLQLTPGIDPEAIALRFVRLLDRPTHACFVLCENDLVVGFVVAEHRSLLQVGDRVELISLVVEDRLRRQGAGGTLVAAAEAWARRRGVEDMVVRSSVLRDASHPFYLRIGYAHHKTQHVYTRKLTS